MEPKHTYHETKVFDILEHWKPVDVPEYLETRILARLEAPVASKAIRWAWATLAVIILVNVFAATRYVRSSTENSSPYQEYIESSRETYNLYQLQS